MLLAELFEDGEDELADDALERVLLELVRLAAVELEDEDCDDRELDESDELDVGLSVELLLELDWLEPELWLVFDDELLELVRLNRVELDELEDDRRKVELLELDEFELYDEDDEFPRDDELDVSDSLVELDELDEPEVGSEWSELLE